MRNRSVVRAFTIIEHLAANRSWLPLSQIASDVELDQATTHRFLATLRELGYVRQQPEGSAYRLGMKFAWIAAQILESVELRATARPIMRRLSAKTGETVHLAVLEADSVVYVDKVDGAQAVLMRSRIGSRGSVHSTAVGKTLLAFAEPSAQEGLLRRLRLLPLTQATIMDKPTLRAEIAAVRDRGYAFDNEENEAGIRCVGAPIFDASGSVIAAMSVTGWIVTMTPEKAAQCAPDLLAACAELSGDLGFPGVPSGAAGGVARAGRAGAARRDGVDRQTRSDGVQGVAARAKAGSRRAGGSI
jgi:DNA-binding IclR family transcriptional regulator